MNAPEFDLPAAHRYFAAACFNLAWELIDKPDRSSDEDERMLQLNQASLWHWSQRADCQERNLSIGYWQASRIHWLLQRANEAMRYAELCLLHTPKDDAFLMGYAHEALARSANLAGDVESFARHLGSASTFAAKVGDDEDRQMLESDLNSLRQSAT
jgi:hypothetical protein